MTRDVALDHFSYWWRSQKVGKYAMKTGCFSLPVGNIDHLSCLKKGNIPSKVEFANTVNSGVSVLLLVARFCWSGFQIVYYSKVFFDYKLYLHVF